MIIIGVRPGLEREGAFAIGRAAGNSMQRTLLLSALTALTLLAHAQSQDVRVLHNGELTGWETKEFKGITRYTTLHDVRAPIIKAESLGTASGMLRKITVDLEKTPYLNWRWRIVNVLTGNDERSKAGDDYPARIYVVVSGGLFFWNTRAVNYVWSSHQAPDTTWANAYTDNAHMVAVRSGQREADQWLQEKRNVRDDLRKVFGEDIKKIHAVAFMTDTDNTSQAATAYYGDIFFSSQ